MQVFTGLEMCFNYLRVISMCSSGPTWTEIDSLVVYSLLYARLTSLDLLLEGAK